jgi:hypothetical protein
MSEKTSMFKDLFTLAASAASAYPLKCSAAYEDTFLALLHNYFEMLEKALRARRGLDYSRGAADEPMTEAQFEAEVKRHFECAWMMAQELESHCSSRLSMQGYEACLEPSEAR